MSSLNLTAPAKLNLFLHVTGRRGDGYHQLQTFFQLLEIGDRVTLERREDGEIRRLEGLAGLPPERDLAVRAANLLKTRAGCAAGCSIRINKTIPVGGGLGGGSSDAAAVLVGLNRLWGLDFSGDELAAVGLELGADVPLFVVGQSAWAEGVGERLTPLSVGPVCYLVVTPGCEVSTARIFDAPTLTRNTTPLTIDRFTHGPGGKALNFDALWRATRNDCQSVVRELYPPVDAALRWLSDFAEARMTGTGASVFAPFPDPAEAERVLGQLPAEFRGFVARGVDRASR